MNKKNESLDSNGNIIRGRKIDSPHLVVVKELRDLEDQEETTAGAAEFTLNPKGYTSGSCYEEEIQQWNSRERKEFKSSLAKQTNQQLKSKSKSQDKKSRYKNKKANKLRADQVHAQEIEGQNQEPQKALDQQQNKQSKLTNNSVRGTKSQREIRSSMGFNELLNQLDKDVSIQQSNQVDFKNRTTHDLLKLELSGIRRQNSSNGNIANQQNINISKAQQKSKTTEKKRVQKQQTQEKSKSKERNATSIAQKQNEGVALFPKSILKKNSDYKAKEQIFQYALNNVAPDITPEKNQGINAASFLHSEHGRCVTSQAVNQSQQYFQCNNERALSSQNIGGPNKIIFSKLKTTTWQDNIGSSTSNANKYRDQSSPDRGGAGYQVRDFKPIGNIDKLIRENIKKKKNKEDEEKVMKQESEEKWKRKKEQIEQANNLVRQINKEKTYRKQSSQVAPFQNYQQSQDFVKTDGINLKVLKASKWDEKFKQINKKLEKDLFIQKSSQSQKIDFQKIKVDNAKKLKKNFNLKNHRKSYGLEFIDIKKEIAEELKTLELKLKSDHPLLPRQQVSFHRNQAISANNTDQSIKRLKVKYHRAGGESQTKENTMNEFKSEREPPKVEKIIVIKKSKIRKFMKLKKKEKQKEKTLHNQEEILKTIKMQENISKLNQFCKKNLQKCIHKKKNATLQNNELAVVGENDQVPADYSKISGRKLVFDYSRSNINKSNVDKQSSAAQVNINNNNFNDNEDDSSRLSTEFYEEYFRLLNSIKKEQQQQQKVQDNESISKIENFIDMSLNQNNKSSVILKSPQNKSQSPSHNSNSETQKQIVLSPKQSQQQQYLADHNKQQKSSSLSQIKGIGKKNKSKGALQEPRNHQQPLLQNAQSKQTMISNSMNITKSKERAESAPLIVGQNLQKKRPPSSGSISKKKKKKQQQVKDEARENAEQKVQYIMNQILKIQRAYRQHLDDKGFYQQSSSSTVQRHTPITEEEFQTQVPITVEHQQDNTIQRIAKLNEELKKTLDNDDSDLMNADAGERGGDELEPEDEDDEDDEEIDCGNLIIINQQTIDDDKKVVYLSNINSCSLPQTPKADEQPQKSQFNKNGAQGGIDNIKKVFDYKPGSSILDQNQFFSQTSSIDHEVHQSISQKPSLEYVEDSDQKIPTSQLGHNNNQITTIINHEDEEEIKNDGKDYQMRLFTGSESLLREFKMNTPKHIQQQNLMLPHDQIIEQQSVRNLTSHNSQSSLSQKILQHHQQQQSALDSKKSFNDQTSLSSQSLFERNSFQQFTMQKLQQMVKNNEFMNLIQMREKALEYRQEKEKKFIKKLYKNKQLSPRTYQQKREQLEKFVRLEQEEIKKTKKQFQEEWQKTIQMIEETQRNVDLMREKMKIQIDNNKYHQQLFNSQSSRNSSSSYVTTHKQEPSRKSILEQEEFQPLSQRSLRISNISASATIDSKIKSQKQTLQQDSIQSNQNNNITSQKPQQTQAAGENLIEFLETSWVKNQQQQKEQLATLNDNRQGIFIEDQKNQNEINSNIDDAESELSPEKLILDFNAQQQNELHNDERPLIRSRSEQDLSELINKNKITLEDLDAAYPGPKQQEALQEETKQSDMKNAYKVSSNDDDSFRVLDSERDNKIVGNKLILNRNNHQEIKIQENFFDESSQKYEQKEGQNDDFQSNDSLLNESDLNNYFQEQKFSIEDFKQLDKRKLLQSDEDLHETQDAMLHIKNAPIQQQLVDYPDQQNSKRLNTEEDNGLESQPLYHDSIPPRALTPDIQTSNYLQHQSALLFQNAKPGENIKIADILKKTQSLNDNISMNSFILNDSNNNSQIVFQNQQINQSMNIPSTQPLLVAPGERNSLTEQITEEIVQMLLTQEFKIPQRQLQQTTPEPTQQIAQPQPTDNQDVFIIDVQYNEKEQRRETIDFKQRLLIESDLMRVENYINEVIASLQHYELQYLQNLTNNTMTEQDANLNPHRQFLQVLTTPIKKNELDLLNQLQTSEIGSYEHFETAQEQAAHPIVPVDLYLDIERQREENHLRILQENGIPEVNQEDSIIQESLHIHNKAIFDSLNESLMKFRPYGLQGEPMPWSNRNRRLQTKVDTNQVDTERLFMMVKQDVMRWAQNFAGCHPSPIFLYKKQPDQNADQVQQQQQQEQFDEEIFQETRERRLAQMLATEVIETEHQWLNYEFEEAQVKIDLSDMILEHLVEEAVMFLNLKKGINIDSLNAAE